MINISSLIPKVLIPRQIEPEIQKYIKDREIIAIRGPRQSGKTTLLLKIAQQLIDLDGENSVVYISFEDELERLRFEKDPKSFVDYYQQKEGIIYLLLDEVQYLKNAGQTLKFIYDLYPKIKLIVSGSSTLDISRLSEFLVGRVVFFELLPLSFAEFISIKDLRLAVEYQKKQFSLKKPCACQSIFDQELNQYLGEYQTYGGYPRLVLETDMEKKKTLLSNLFSTYIEKDIVKLYGLPYREKAIIVLKYLAEIVGNVVNYHDLSQAAGLSFNQIKEILRIFVETYVISPVFPFHQNLVTELKKNPKYYFRDLGFRNLLVNRFEFNQAEKGQLAENYVYNVLADQRLSYWRTTAKAEVDFVLREGKIPIEVKLTPKIERSLLSYIGTYKPEVAVMASVSAKPPVIRSKTTIYTIPLSLL